MLAHKINKIKPRHCIHIAICNDEIETVFLKQFQCVLRALTGRHVMTIKPEAHELRDVRIIVNDQHPQPGIRVGITTIITTRQNQWQSDNKG